VSVALIDGIGGAFVFSNDATALAEWYAGAFGFQFEGDAEFGAFYQMFWGLDPEDPERKMDTTFAIMQATVPLPKLELGGAPEADGAASEAGEAESEAGEAEPADESMYGDQPFMINLRVRDLDAVLAHLAERGLQPIKRTDYDYGLFAWVRDLDGNRVELYQPVPPQPDAD
jgi:uncharacterized glyoxalase superfamily protein PhnB